MNETPSSFGARAALRGNNGRKPDGPDQAAVTRDGAGSRPDDGLARAARLSRLHASLQAALLQGDLGEASQAVALSRDEDGLTLRIGDEARVTIDGDTGFFVFQEGDLGTGTIFVSASAEKFLDHVTHSLFRQSAPVAASLDDAARNLVGRSLHEVERRLILHTLNYCGGNRTRTAQMLGVSLRTVRNKLRKYWENADVAGAPS